MASFNQVVLVGNLTKDQETMKSKSGDVSCFTIAVNNGGKDDECGFFDVCLCGKSVANVSKYLTKGKCVLVNGQLRVNKYTDKNGIKREKYQIVSYNIQLLSSTQKKAEGNVAVENIAPTDNQLPF